MYYSNYPTVDLDKVISIEVISRGILFHNAYGNKNVVWLIDEDRLKWKIFEAVKKQHDTELKVRN